MWRRARLYFAAFWLGSFLTLAGVFLYGEPAGNALGRVGARLSLAGGELYPLTQAELKQAADAAVTASLVALYGAPTKGKK